jgi:two-component system cell cycle response regulator DivK
MLRILYVEDNAANLSLVHRVARVGGHEVVNRTSGESTLKDFTSIKPDLVLMDIQLEGPMSGLDVVRKLRADGYTDIPIVAVTAYAMKGDKEKALAAGCDSYLPKPLPITELVALIDKYQKEMTKRKTSEVLKVVPQADAAESETPEPQPESKVDSKAATKTTGETSVTNEAPGNEESISPIEAPSSVTLADKEATSSAEVKTAPTVDENIKSGELKTVATSETKVPVIESETPSDKSVEETLKAEAVAPETVAVQAESLPSTEDGQSSGQNSES